MAPAAHIPRLGAMLGPSALLALLPAIPADAARASPSDSRPGLGLQWYDITAQAVKAAVLLGPISPDCRLSELGGHAAGSGLRSTLAGAPSAPTSFSGRQRSS